MRILAVDPAIRHTGYAIVEGDNRQQRCLDYGVISFKPTVKQSQCLLGISQHLSHLVEKWQPQQMAMEKIIFVQSIDTAIIMGSARAASMIAAAAAGLEIHEYSPSSVKLAVTGRGAASKDQVAFMVRALFKLTSTPPSDAADALAIAYAHLNAADPLKKALLQSRTL